MPSSALGVVDNTAWDKRISELLDSQEVNHGLVRLMQEISIQLSQGVDSHVTNPGCTLTHGQNWFSRGSPAENATVKVIDALASFTRAGHVVVAGPLFNEDHSEYKINPIMAIKKPGGHVRVVGNLKWPPSQSFNDGIPEEKLSDWPVSMMTASKFSKLAGRSQSTYGVLRYEGRVQDVTCLLETKETTSLQISWN